MIPQRYILEWKSVAPWTNEAQVEQDLVISRALVEMFSSPLIRETLAFRGGTALHKLYIQPQVRYSEDIDLVQIKPAPINPILKEIRERLVFLGTKRTVKQHIHNNTVIYRFESEFPPVIDLRLKIEINTREHFSVLGLKQTPFQVTNSWFTGKYPRMEIRSPLDKRGTSGTGFGYQSCTGGNVLIATHQGDFGVSWWYGSAQTLHTTTGALFGRHRLGTDKAGSD